MEGTESEFKDYQAINRGVGGASLLDLQYYAKDIMYPYQPKQILIYCGENDLPSYTVDAKMLYSRYI